ncbi:hypothetical protein HYV30_02955 [Candidatus Kaiserbacteria bacterium]|nr:hypothetical protein [Candidatus Kaiserbacteria bacterium]
MIEFENVATLVVMLLILAVPAFAVAAGIGAYRLSCWLADRNPIRVENEIHQRARLVSREKNGMGPRNGPTVSVCVGQPKGGAERW